jgi:predicted nucleotidyltransferase
MGALQEISLRTGADARTLRRAVEQGTVRAHRPSPRRLEMHPAEQRYLARSWPLLAALRRGLRTERSVRLAVLFGSAATGAADASSDVDLLVDGPGLDPPQRVRLSMRLGRAIGRRVHVVPLEDAHSAPSLFLDTLEEGRVLVDREGRWPELKSREPQVRRTARAAERRTMERAAAAAAQARARLA